MAASVPPSWPAWLARAGLSRYARRFESLCMDDAAFRALQVEVRVLLSLRLDSPLVLRTTLR